MTPQPAVGSGGVLADKWDAATALFEINPKCDAVDIHVNIFSRYRLDQADAWFSLYFLRHRRRTVFELAENFQHARQGPEMGEDRFDITAEFEMAPSDGAVEIGVSRRRHRLEKLLP